MPSWWTDKEERQYEHVKASLLREGGYSIEEVRRIAAATVNKGRGKKKRKKKR